MMRATALAWAGLIPLWAALWATACPATEPTEALAGSAGHRIDLDLRVRGDLFATAAAGAEPVRRPITLDARFEFLEQPAADAEGKAVARR